MGSRSHSAAPTWRLGLALALVAACGGGPGGEGANAVPEGGMAEAITSTVVFAPGEATQAAQVTPTPLADGTRLLGIGPEGDLWLADANLAWGLTPVGDDKALPAELADADWVSVESASLGLAVVDGTLLEVRGPIARPLALPPEAGTPRQACGNLELSLFVASDTGLWQRERGRWFEWDTPHEGGVAQLGSMHGACAGEDGLVWFVQQGELFGLDPAPGRSSIKTTGLTDVSRLVGDGVAGFAARAAGTLVIDAPHFVQVTGLELDDRTWAVGAGALWVMPASGEGLFRYEGGIWTRLTGTLPGGELTAMVADAAGQLWLQDASGLHRVRVDDRALFVHGVSPWQNVPPGARQVRITGSAALDDVQVTLDGEALPTTVDDTGAHVASVPAGTTGPHALVVEASSEGQALTREVPFVVQPLDVTWASHIEPLYEGRCARCHDSGEMGAPQLGGLDGWRGGVETILGRIEKGEMPPDAPLKPSEVQLVRDWMEGGLEP